MNIIQTINTNDIQPVFNHLTPHELITIINNEHDQLDVDTPNDNTLHNDLYACAINALLELENIHDSIEQILDYVKQ